MAIHIIKDVIGAITADNIDEKLRGHISEVKDIILQRKIADLKIQTRIEEIDSSRARVYTDLIEKH